MYRNLLLAPLFLLLFITLPLLADGLLVGTAVVDISPTVKPFQLRSGKSTYVHDPLHVRAVAFENGQCRAVIAVMDAIGVGRDMCDEAKAAAADNQRAVAVVLDDIVFSAPNVNSAILNGRSQISFGTGQTAEQKLQEAEDLASLLKAGSLPAPARIVDEVSVGPQLGEENIQAGLSSFIFALLVVLLYMIFYYRGAGVVSNIALIANLFFLIGALASLGASLTLPGIAGIVLTIGMAVDANVLIY